MSNTRLTCMGSRIGARIARLLLQASVTIQKDSATDLHCTRRDGHLGRNFEITNVNWMQIDSL